MTQVIEIDEFGRPSSIRMPDGVGFDLRHFGSVSMRRISEVLMDEDHQKYYVQFPDGSKLINTRLATITIPNQYDLFESYELAVAAEIEWYNHSKTSQ